MSLFVIANENHKSQINFYAKNDTKICVNFSDTLQSIVVIF